VTGCLGPSRVNGLSTITLTGADKSCQRAGRRERSTSRESRVAEFLTWDSSRAPQSLGEPPVLLRGPPSQRIEPFLSSHVWQVESAVLLSTERSEDGQLRATLWHSNRESPFEPKGVQERMKPACLGVEERATRRCVPGTRFVRWGNTCAHGWGLWQRQLLKLV